MSTICWPNTLQIHDINKEYAGVVRAFRENVQAQAQSSQAHTDESKLKKGTSWSEADTSYQVRPQPEQKSLINNVIVSHDLNPRAPWAEAGSDRSNRQGYEYGETAI